MARREGVVQVSGGRVWFQVVGEESQRHCLSFMVDPDFRTTTWNHSRLYRMNGWVIFYDQLGCGTSDRPEDTSLWRMGRFVLELAQVRTALNVDRVHLLGHSWGAMLAMDYMLTKPTGVVSLILASPPLSIPRWLMMHGPIAERFQ